MRISLIRAATAVFVGFILCWAPVGLCLMQRYWGAFGVFSPDEWLQLAPEILARYLDYAIGLSAALGIWMAWRRIPRTVLAATIVGALGSYLGLQLYVVAYLLLEHPEVFFATFRLSSITGPMCRLVPSVLTGAVLGASMFLIAYRRDKV